MKAKLYFLFFVIVTLQSIAQEINLVKNINTDVLFKSSNPIGLIEYNGKFYFTADDKIHGREIWVSDGTENGTVLLKDIRSGSNSSTPNNFYKFNGFLYFVANQDIWRTDGTEQGTILIKDFDTNLSFSGRVNYFTEYNNHLYFAAGDGENGIELWKSDGSTDGTFMLKDINLESHSNPTQNSESSEPRYLTVLNNKLYFTANDGINGFELWESNGTEGGTKLAVDIKLGSESSVPTHIAAYNNKIYFFADGPGQEGKELWVSDGTAGGTNLFFDINPEGDATHTFMPMIIFNNQLYFVAGGPNTLSNRTDFGHELWKTDGTTQGTTRITDIFPNEGSSSPNHLTIHQNKLYFSAAAFSDNALPQRRLWVTDGTTQGTTEVKNANNESIEFPEHMLSFGDKIYMSYNIDSSIGKELYSFSPSSSNNNPTVAIPDQNFEQYLIRNNLDDELDGEVLISNISGLTSLNISGIDIADLTGIEAFTSLETLLVANNPNLTTINVSSNTNLKILNTSSTGITTIDISANTNLEEFRSESTGLSALDIMGNFNLKKLFLRENAFTSFEIFSTSVLEELDVSVNQLTAVNVEVATQLKKIFVNNNNLENLIVSNVTNITDFNARNNPNLSCIQVDDVTYATTNFTNIDAQTSFNVNCAATERTYVPDDNFEQYLIDRGLDTAPLDDYVPTINIASVDMVNVSGLNINNLVGIQDFTNLQHLDASNNNLTALRLQEINSLVSLNVNNNNLSVLKFNAINTQEYNSTGNENLSCVTVDDVNATSQFVTLNKDDHTFFSTNCSGIETYVPDDNFEQRLINFGLDDVLDNYVLTSKILGPEDDKLTSINLNGAQIKDLTGIRDFKNLTSLVVSSNQLTSLDVRGISGLQVIQASFNNLTSINVSNNLALKNIQITNNELTALNLRNNSSLEKINCTSNSNLNELLLPTGSSVKEIRASFCNLNSLSLPQSLEILDINNNAFTSLDVRNLRQLEILTCRNNQMETLQFQNNVKLKTAIVRDNDITTINLNDSPLLEELWVNDNNLSTLTIKSGDGNLASLTTFTAIRNPNLTCIEVDDVVHARENLASNTDTQTNFYFDCNFASDDFVAVPDNVFEQKLIDKGLDNTLDNHVLRTNIQNVTELNLSTLNGNPKITNLKGLEAFVNLRNLYISNNDVSNVDISDNENLIEFHAQSCNISALQLPASPDLKLIDIHTNNISNLNVSSYTNLSFLQIDSNSITSINTSQNEALSYFSASNNSLKNLDFSNNIALKKLYLSSTAIKGVNIANNINLEELNVSRNNINSLELNNNIKLKNLHVRGNELTILDVRQNRKLESLDCSSNSIATLDLTNNIRLTELNAIGNNLSCIKVFDIAFANANWSNNIDANTSFGNNCYTAIPDANFEQALIDAGHDTVLDGFISTNIASAITSLTITDKNISSISGVEAFSSLTSLGLKGNNLTTVDLSNNTQLTTLFINNNQLDRLDISNNTRLQIFDAKNNTNLTCIQVWDVNFAERNWSDDVDTSVVFSINCDDVWTIDVDGKTQTVLNNVSGLDKDGDGKITLKEASEFTGKLDLKGKSLDNIKGLQAFNKITALDLSDNNIKDLSALTGKTITLISKTTGKKREVSAKASKLETLIVSNNSFETINLEELKDLKVINVSSNPNLGTISIKNGNNETITNFNASNTPKLTCIFVDDINASYLQTWVKDTKANFVADERACRQNVLSVNNQTLENTISLYPNPVSDYLVIQSQLKLDAIEVYTIMGKQLVKTKENKVDFSDFSSGVYVVRILADDKVLTKRIMKQ